MIELLFAPVLSLLSVQASMPAPATQWVQAPAAQSCSGNPFVDWIGPWPWMQTPTPSAGASVPEAFIPASSMFVLRFASVDAAIQAIEPFVPGSVIGGVSDPLDLLKLIAEIDLPVDQIDASRPILIAWRMEDTELAPEASFIVTCKDPAAFRAPLEKAGWSCTTSGRIVACSASEPGPLLAADAPLRIGLDRHDVVLRIAMDKVMDQFGDQVHSSVDQIAEEAESDGGASKQGLTEMFDGIRDAIDSVEMLEAGLSIVGDDARVTLEMTASDGSSLASVDKVEAKNLPDIARLIDPDASLACITALDFTKFMDSFQWAMDAAAAEMPAAEKGQFEAAMKTSRDLYALAGPTMGVSGSFDESGLHAFGLMSAPDAGAYLVKMMDLVKTSVPWMKLLGPDVSKVDGVDVSTFHFEFDFAAMPQLSALDDAAKEKQLDEAEKAMKALFGPDGLSLSMAPKNGALVFGLGGVGEMHTALARMASKKPSSTGAQMLELLGQMNPGIVYHLDIAQMLDGLVSFSKQVDPSKSAPRELERLRSFPPMTLAAGVEGRVWRIVFSTDASKMKVLVKQIGDLQPKLPAADPNTPRQRAIDDIGEITDALDEYADDHDGKYPDTLQPLIAKNANGERYLDRDELPIDPWGRAYLYDPPKDADGDPRVYTYGADGKPGGDGDDEDIDNDTDDE